MKIRIELEDEGYIEVQGHRDTIETLIELLMNATDGLIAGGFGGKKS